MEQNKIDPRLIEAAEEGYNFILGHALADGTENGLDEESFKEGFVAGAMWVINNPTGGELLYVNQKAFKLGEREAFEKMVEIVRSVRVDGEHGDFAVDLLKMMSKELK